MAARHSVWPGGKFTSEPNSSQQPRQGARSLPQRHQAPAANHRLCSARPIDRLRERNFQTRTPCCRCLRRQGCPSPVGVSREWRRRFGNCHLGLVLQISGRAAQAGVNPSRPATGLTSMMYGEVQTGAPRRRAYRSGQQVPLTTFLMRIYRCASDNETTTLLKTY